MNRATALRLVFDFARENGTAEVRAAVEIAERKKGGAVVESGRGLAFADWFRSTLSEGARLGANWRTDWARCFDEMLSLDGRTPEEVFAVCKWARSHDFWRGNFLTPRKLRQTKSGVMYFDRFAESMKGAATRPAKRVQPKGYAIEKGAGPVAVSALDLLRRKP